MTEFLEEILWFFCQTSAGLILKVDIEISHIDTEFSHQLINEDVGI